VKERIQKIIIEVLGELNESYTNEGLSNLTEDTELYGENGALDSLDLAYLMTSLEEKISNEFNKDIILGDDQTMHNNNSPFQTIKILASYITQLLNENS